MPLRQTDSIILKTYNLAEADRIVVLFTRDFGMVRGVAKGARRLKSKFGSMLEPFSEIHVEYFEKEERELVSLQHADLIRSSFHAAANPELLTTYAYLSDLLQTFAPPHDPNETLYRMVRAALSVEVADSFDAALLRLYFEMWILRLGGFLPDWTICGSCRRVLNDTESTTLSENFQLICGSCLGSSLPGDTVPPIYRSIVADAQALPPGEFVEEKRSAGEAAAELSLIFVRIISAASGRPAANRASS
jgi:DNA repair protein RecO (recombination protein O)